MIFHSKAARITVPRRKCDFKAIRHRFRCLCAAVFIAPDVYAADLVTGIQRIGIPAIPLQIEMRKPALRSFDRLVQILQNCRGKAAYFVCEHLMIRFNDQVDLLLLSRYSRKYPCKSEILCDIKMLKIPVFQISYDLLYRIIPVLFAHMRSPFRHSRHALFDP